MKNDNLYNYKLEQGSVICQSIKDNTIKSAYPTLLILAVRILFIFVTDSSCHSFKSSFWICLPLYLFRNAEVQFNIKLCDSSIAWLHGVIMFTITTQNSFARRPTKVSWGLAVSLPGATVHLELKPRFASAASGNHDCCLHIHKSHAMSWNTTRTRDKQRYNFIFVGIIIYKCTCECFSLYSLITKLKLRNSHRITLN